MFQTWVPCSKMIGSVMEVFLSLFLEGTLAIRCSLGRVAPSGREELRLASEASSCFLLVSSETDLSSVEREKSSLAVAFNCALCIGKLDISNPC